MLTHQEIRALVRAAAAGIDRRDSQTPEAYLNDRALEVQLGTR
jgi:hypothetical protein